MPLTLLERTTFEREPVRARLLQAKQKRMPQRAQDPLVVQSKSVDGVASDDS
jgi:hypothetical protein